MNAIEWSKNHLQNTSSQKVLEEKVELLLIGALSTRSEYAKEKAIKSFCETIRCLEGNLLYQRDIHPSKLDMLEFSKNPNECIKKHKEVEQIIESEIKRQFRHYTEFL